MNKIKTTGHFSYNVGELPEGCKLCVQGKKLVLFITGVCPRNCWYCPIADNKVQADIIYANESKTNSIEEAINEAKLCNSKGLGITGGDPFTRLERCISYIKAFKKEFGIKFHIHLYTSFDLVTETNLRQLFESGLDEIRFHPDLENQTNWHRIKLAKKFSWKVGIEIPCIPDYQKQTFELIEFFKDKVDFINLNELEAADSKHNKVFDKGYKSRDEYSYGILGSEELAKEIMEKYSNLNIHFCTSKLKNIEQLGNRIKLRAKNIKKHFDIMTEEGALIRGAIYTEKPSFGYQELLKSKNKDEEIKKLKLLRDKLCKELRMNKKDIDIDEIKYRLLTSRKVVEKYKDKIKSFNLVPAIVEELATGDLFEIEIEFL